MKPMTAEAYREIIQSLLELAHPTKQDLDYLKLKIARKYRLGKVPSNAEIIQHLKKIKTVHKVTHLR